MLDLSHALFWIQQNIELWIIVIFWSMGDWNTYILSGWTGLLYRRQNSWISCSQLIISLFLLLNERLVFAINYVIYTRNASWKYWIIWPFVLQLTSRSFDMSPSPQHAWFLYSRPLILLFTSKVISRISTNMTKPGMFVLMLTHFQGWFQN